MHKCRSGLPSLFCSSCLSRFALPIQDVIPIQTCPNHNQGCPMSHSFCLSRIALPLQVFIPVPMGPNVDQRCPASFVLFVLVVLRCPFNMFNQYKLAQMWISAAVCFSFSLGALCCPFKIFNLRQLAKMSTRATMSPFILCN